MDTKAIEEHIRGILIALGDDPNREGLVDTPKRVAKMYKEVFAGMAYTNHEIAQMFGMKATVAYIPCGKIIGLSKIARICDMVGRRLQLQERIGCDIADIMTEVTGSPDVAVILEGCHSCVSARGIEKTGTKTVTMERRGRFLNDSSLQIYLQ